MLYLITNKTSGDSSHLITWKPNPALLTQTTSSSIRTCSPRQNRQKPDDSGWNVVDDNLLWPLFPSGGVGDERRDDDDATRSSSRHATNNETRETHPAYHPAGSKDPRVRRWGWAPGGRSDPPVTG